MTPIEVLKMLKSKIDEAGLYNCTYVIEPSDIEAINRALLLYDVSNSCCDNPELDKGMQHGWGKKLCKNCGGHIAI